MGRLNNKMSDAEFIKELKEIQNDPNFQEEIRTFILSTTSEIEEKKKVKKK